MISESVTLSFNPETSSPEIQKVFTSELARILWLAIRQGHMVNKHFNSAVLKYAEIIESSKKKGELNAQTLFRILSSFAKQPTCAVIGPGEQLFAEELLPFINGEKTIAFTVNK